MRKYLLFTAKLFFFAMLIMLALLFVPPSNALHGLAAPFARLFGVVCVWALLTYLLLPTTRDARLGELGLMGKHGLRKTDVNSYTYFVDHPTLADGSPNTKLLRFFFELGGKEVEAVLPLARVRIQVIEHKSAASVEFCFHDDQKGRCGKRAALARDPLWWIAESHVMETGFMYALLVLSPEEFKQEVYLRTGVQQF